MSYILDALKKSQSEQAADGVALRVQQTPARKALNPWLIAVLIVVLLLNAGLLGWLFLQQQPPLATDNQPQPAPGAATVPDNQAVDATTPQVAPTIAATTANPPAQSAAPAPAMSARVAQAAPRVITQPAPAPVAVPVPRLALRELPAAEQSLYNGFTYSTHIFTDDPTLCAIVVDGQRLQIGDAFKGLRVAAITEDGVVFEENRRGVVREIAVNLLEQWEG
jgi:hypothetical protein